MLKDYILNSVCGLVVLQILSNSMICRANTTISSITTISGRGKLMDILLQPTTPFDIEDVMNIDFGKYTTQEFTFHNIEHTFLIEPWIRDRHPTRGAMYNQECSAQYVKCIANLEIPLPVCAYNWPTDYEKGLGYGTFESYCQVYVENCFRFHKRHRIIAYGNCWIQEKDEKLEIYPFDNTVGLGRWKDKPYF